MSIEQRNRSFFYDNVKFILIVFMVLGHFAFENSGNSLMNGLCNAIYSFHMPLFILVSGYFSKSIHSQRLSDIKNLVIPYLLFEMIHFGFTKITGLGRGHIQFTIPTYQDWYLLSLFTWRMAIPYFKSIPKNLALTIALVVALGAGFVHNFNDFLSLYRSLYLFPYFLIGYYLEDIEKHIQKFNRYRLIFSVCFILLFMGILIISHENPRLSQRLSYAFIPNFGYSDEISDLYFRTLAFAVSGIMGFLFLFIVPQKQSTISALGSRTFTVYLVHIFIIWTYLAYVGPVKNNLSMAIGILFSILISLILSSSLAEKIFSPFCRPFDFLKAKKST